MGWWQRLWKQWGRDKEKWGPKAAGAQKQHMWGGARLLREGHVAGADIVRIQVAAVALGPELEQLLASNALHPHLILDSKTRGYCPHVKLEIKSHLVIM